GLRRRAAGARRGGAGGGGLRPGAGPRAPAGDGGARHRFTAGVLRSHRAPPRPGGGAFGRRAAMSERALYFQELVAGRRRRKRDRLLLALLRLLSHPYGLILRLRAAGYRLGLLRSYRLPCPVVSVGNLTLGGTGKTPMTALIAAYFMARGKRVAVLSRGYGGSARGAVRIVS